MKRILCVLLIVLLLPIGAAADDIWGKKPTTHRVGYFDYAIPTGYIDAPLDDNAYCTKKFPSDRGYYIKFFVTDYTSVSDEMLEMYYLLLANSTAPNRYNFEEITVDGYPACIYQYPTSSGDFTVVAYHRNGFTLCCAIGSKYASLSAQKSFILSLAEKVRYNDPTAEVVVSQIGRAKKFVNLRAEPNADSAKLGSLNAGEEVGIICSYYTEKWHQITYDGYTCYVSANYIDLE